MCYKGNHKELRMKLFSSESQKNYLSSDCFLKLENMKLESLVIVDQHATVNTFSGLVHTARHTMGIGFTLSRWVNSQERQPTTVGSVTGVKS